MDSTTLGTVIGWVVVAGVPALAASALFVRFTNTFKHQGSQTLLFAAVKRYIETYNLAVAAGEPREARKAMRCLVARAREYGARNKRDAYTIVAKWMIDYKKARES